MNGIAQQPRVGRMSQRLAYTRRTWRNRFLTLLGFIRYILRYWKEIVTVLGTVAGWFLITWALADLLKVWQVWPLMWGLFLLGCVGFGFLKQIAVDGLYVLSVKKPDNT